MGDEAPEAEPAILALTTAAAAALRRSWDDRSPPPAPPAALFDAARTVAPERATVRTAEGYAFYALYPEQYREAARGLTPDMRAIGVRSIGAGLACVVAEAIGAASPTTVRPTGHPFARTVSLPHVDPDASYAVVDEGPGLSGSSFGAVADALEAKGVAAEHIAFLPSHDGDIGAQASEPHRRRWATARRLHVGFDALIAQRLPEWVEDLTGPATSVEDLSGGAWRALTYGKDEASWPPAAAHQERRKFLLRSARGAFLLKFAGLGRSGEAALARAKALHAAGWTPEPLALRHGFLVERWVGGRAATTEEIAAALPAYLAFRATLASPERGASVDELAAMARANVAAAFNDRVAAAHVPDPPLEVGPAIAIDGRLHRWEWRVDQGGRLFKTDAVDHAFAHDLIGPQPIDWDQAGASVEHAVYDPTWSKFPFWSVAYVAFQIGLWTMATQALAAWPEEAARCADRVDHYKTGLTLEWALT